MAKGDNQKLAKSARKANKGQKDRRKGFNKSVSTVSESTKRQNLRKMVDSLIENDSKAASKHLHEYLNAKSRQLILGEEHDEDEMDAEKIDRDDDDDDEDDDDDDDKDRDDDDDEDDDDDDDDDDKDRDDDDDDREEVSEATYRDVKRNNNAKHLEDKVKGKNYGRRGKSKMNKYRHKNSADHLSGDVKGDALADPHGKGKLSKYQHGNSSPHLSGDVNSEVDVADHKKGGRKNRTS